MSKLLIVLLFGGLWIVGGQRSEDSVLILIAVLLIFYLVLRKQNSKKKFADSNLNKTETDGEDDMDYEASYKVTEFHNDFTKVGQGVRVPDHQIASCCNPFQGHNRPRLLSIEDKKNKEE